MTIYGFNYENVLILIGYKSRIGGYNSSDILKNEHFHSETWEELEKEMKNRGAEFIGYSLEER